MESSGEKNILLKQSIRNLSSAFSKDSLTTINESSRQLSCQSSAMSPRRVLEVRPGDQDSQKWRVSLSEDAFDSFIARGGDAARKVFGEGSLFSPLLFGKFFDPADAFPLWEFDSEILLSGLRSASKTSVDWDETDSEYVLRAELPGSLQNSPYKYEEIISSSGELQVL